MDSKEMKISYGKNVFIHFKALEGKTVLESTEESSLCNMFMAETIFSRKFSSI